MSYSDFMNKKCSISRVVKTATPNTNTFGEQVNIPTVVKTRIPCRIEKSVEKELIEAYCAGDFKKSLFIVFVEMGTGIYTGDVLTIEGRVEDFLGLNEHSNELKVLDVDDAGGCEGHHVECIARYREEVD